MHQAVKIFDKQIHSLRVSAPRGNADFMLERELRIEYVYCLAHETLVR